MEFALNVNITGPKHNCSRSSWLGHINLLTLEHVHKTYIVNARMLIDGCKQSMNVNQMTMYEFRELSCWKMVEKRLWWKIWDSALVKLLIFTKQFKFSLLWEESSLQSLSHSFSANGLSFYISKLQKINRSFTFIFNVYTFRKIIRIFEVKEELQVTMDFVIMFSALVLDFIL